MKIAIVGTKGIPARYGGFETFAFHLAKNLSRKHEITVVNEPGNDPIDFNFPVNILYSDFRKGKNPLLFYRQSIQLTAESNDVVLVCGVGGSLFYPLIKRNAKLITNVDGLEHRRGKYSFLQRTVVYFLQRMATLFSDHLVADSKEVERYWKERFSGTRFGISAIAYGAEIPEKFDHSVLNELKVTEQDYFLVVARLVPENNIRMIIDAFKNYSGSEKLVIAGDRAENPFAREISESSYEKIIFAGAIYEKEKLDSLRKNSFGYIHGHSVGGTNPALLEAMVCGCPCICHDNNFNREVTANGQLYFNSADSLTGLMNTFESDARLRSDLSQKAYTRVTQNYSWEYITAQYEAMFESVISERK